jgi:hypothetical protein
MHLPARIGDYTDFYAGLTTRRNAAACSAPTRR